MSRSSSLRLGTRASRLALVQAEWVAAALQRSDPELDVEIVPITTTGDRRSEGRLASVGGKGLFLKEIEEALLARRIDFAVHSMKDVPAAIPVGLALAAVPRRADPRDALLGSRGQGLAGLPPGARIGTASVRRQMQLRAARPDIEVVVLRGVAREIKRIADGLIGTKGVKHGKFVATTTGEIG